MDLKIKKYFVTSDAPGGGTDDEQGGGSTATTKKLVIDSKFRRETSNFKVNFDASSVDPESEAPVLIKYIEKNLKPEELLGLVVSTTMSAQGYSAVLDASTIISVKRVGADFGYYELDTMDKLDGFLFYVPSTGALSLNGPYVEEETTGRAIDLTKLQFDFSTATWSGYETGLGILDFEGAKIITEKGTYDVTDVSTDPTGEPTGFTIKLRTGDASLEYNPTTGQFKVVRPEGSGTA